MFGLENQKKKQTVGGFVFELENELKDPAKQKGIYEKVERRLQRIKEILRMGDSQKEFDHFGFLLHGYHSLLKVISRVTTKRSAK